MKSQTPKVLHPIGGREMLGHVIDSVRTLTPTRAVIVHGDHSTAAADFAATTWPGTVPCLQSPALGTAHAVMQALPVLTDFSGAALVLYADTPLVPASAMSALCEEIFSGASVAVLGFDAADPGAYGRLKISADGSLNAIVEARDASADELEIKLCNSGVMAVDAGFLREYLPTIKNENAKQEYYLTDIVAIAREKGQRCAIVKADERDVLGVNSRAELAAAEKIYQARKRAYAMENGATLLDPETVYLSHDTEIGADVTIGQNVVIGPGVSIEDNAEIKAFSHLEGVRIKSGATVGPFARLRPGAMIGAGAKIGNFVEIKKATIGDDAKISHLSYIGDAEIGASANIGAGAITCNYDGYGKHKTIIGNGAFIGSNSSLVAPVTIGDGAYIGSGSVITKNVDADDLAVARGRQASIKGWAARFRRIHTKKGE